MPKSHLRFWLSATATATALLLTACSDPKAPTEANFRKAIEAMLAGAPECRMLSFYDPKGEKRYRGKIGENDLIFQKAGLIDITDGPTPDGYTETVHDARLWTERKGFCAGTFKLEKVVRWTEPALDQGVTYVRVTYERSFVAVPWATDEVLKALVVPRHDTSQIILYKMSDGWRTHP